MTPSGWAFLSCVGFVFLTFVALRWQHVKRMAALRAALSEAGFAFIEKPTPDDKSRVFDAAAVPTGKQAWRDGAKGVRWCAEGVAQGLPVVLFEHVYHTGSGKSRKAHIHTVASAVGIEGLSKIFVRRRQLLDVLGGIFGGKFVSVGDEAFEQDFRIFVDGDGAMPGAFLTTGLRAWLKEQPSHTALVMGPEGLSVVFAKRVSKHADVLALLSLPAQAIQAMAQHSEQPAASLSRDPNRLVVPD